ncbi:spermidine/putrescine-binding periplasmic protein [Rivularia sp. PCC 7116]|uniref:extracellular solute-binding protein n=1 Tax=Rivularia sp. PCC 7116 TaxID=373994 RepID=UPI00029EEEFB|nr:extracellular solute-binding protein [Rivularia sp. PCC 7116]AFY53711.1 spermidine/putrescine-binding periplasmic protein [Rivularia sp. PCC 7116]
MHRRSFLFGTSTLLISQMLVGCNASKQPQLTVQVLKGSIPGRILKEFQESLSQKAQLKFSPVVQLRQLFKQLRSLQKNEAAQKESEGFDISGLFGKSPAKNIDLLTLGDFWLQEAIEKELIQSLSREDLQNWSNLSPKWQDLVTRNNQGLVDKQGQIWAAPYRWGSTVIIYRKDKLKKFDWKIEDWSDLWREELKGRISLLNQPREVIGLTLKKLGKSYNSENLQSIKSLKEELQVLNQQVKFYNSTNYIEPLILGDTWLAVGWSNDIVSLVSRYPQLGVVVPNSGTALWADLWVQPKVTGKKDETQESLSNKWIDFCWKPQIAKQIAVLTKANSPIDTEIPASEIPKPLQNLLSANPEVFEKSEFLLPLSSSAVKEYDSLFREMKSS